MLLLLLTALTASQAHAEAFPKLNIDPSRITVSGLSAGAYMAAQLEVAYSSLFSGGAMFDGGVYGCAQDSVVFAQVQCMTSPQELKLRDFVEVAKTTADQDQIDPLSSLASHHVYIFSGSKDTTVDPREGKILASFYENFVPASQIETKLDVPAEHGQPTLSDGVGCATGGTPWILNCGYDGAGAALQQLYGGALSPPTQADPSHFHSFSQARFASPEALLGATGYVYIPASCENSATPCALHVSLHGCLQGPDQLGNTYRAHAGYNEWAEANRIVVLYPSATPSLMNPKGCFDWWGYTGPNYLTRDGPQMRAIRDMVAWLAGLGK